MKYHLFFEQGQYAGMFSSLSELLDVLFGSLDGFDHKCNRREQRAYTVVLSLPNKEELVVLTHDVYYGNTDKNELSSSLRERVFQILYSEIQ